MFTIGEFSRLACISARMLRHYDSIGLLHPIMFGESNGYRYYNISQLKEIRKIDKLKQYGFSLNEIKELITLSDSELTNRLKLQYRKLNDQKKYYELMIRNMEADITHKEDFSMNEYHVITMNMKEQKVLTVNRKITVCDDSFHQLAAELRNKLISSNLKQTGPIQISYLDEEFTKENANVEMQVEVSGYDENIKTIPEGLYVTVIHVGSMKEIHLAYQAIMSWLAVNEEYKISGPCIERLIKDENMAKNESELETAVMFPIQLK